MSSDATPETTPDPTPAVDPWDAAVDAAASPPSDQPRDEQGRFATPQEEPETPAEPRGEDAPPEGDAPAEGEPQTEEERREEIRRILKVKLDHEEKEIDLDAEWESEEGRARLREWYEKGYGFDRAQERAKQEALREGQARAIQWFGAQGFRAVQNPATGQWEVRYPQAAIPANGTSPDQGATPDPAKRRLELEQIAKYGSDDDPGAQVEALRELNRMDVEEAVAAQAKAFDEWRAQQTQAQERARMQAHRAQAEASVERQVMAAIEARAKSFDGPDRDRQVQRAKALAMQLAKTSAKSIDEVLAVVNQAADDLDARQEYVKGLLAKQAQERQAEARKHAPSLDGVPTGGASAKPEKVKLKGWDDPRVDDLIESARGG